jgi:tetratricopeptide (TPR) repeat protein
MFIVREANINGGCMGQGISCFLCKNNDDEMIQGFVRLGYSLLNQNKYGRAFLEFQSAINLADATNDSSDIIVEYASEAYIGQYLALYQSDDIKAAIAILEQVPTSARNDKLVKFYTGFYANRTGKTAEANRIFNDIIGRSISCDDEDESPAHDAKQSSVGKIVELDDDVVVVVESFSNKLAAALAYNELGLYKAASDELDAILEIEALPYRLVQLHYFKAQIFVNLTRYSEALEESINAITLDKNYIFAIILTAQMQERLDDSDDGVPREALTSLDMAIAVNKNDTKALIVKAEMLYRHKLYKEVITVCDEVIAINRDVKAAYFAHVLDCKASALMKLDRVDEAIRCYSDAIINAQNNFLYWYNRGAAYLVKGKEEDARKDFDEGYKLYCCGVHSDESICMHAVLNLVTQFAVEPFINNSSLVEQRKQYILEVMRALDTKINLHIRYTNFIDKLQALYNDLDGAQNVFNEARGVDLTLEIDHNSSSDENVGARKVDLHLIGDESSVV